MIAAFIYDLNSDGAVCLLSVLLTFGADILLFDRFHQAVSFNDIVVGVQTQAPAAIIDYRRVLSANRRASFLQRCVVRSCNGQSMQFDPRDASRAVLGALLQTAFGVAPTHRFWNPFLNDSETNFMWDIGHTPFAYFSKSLRLSFAQRDAA